MIVLAFLTDPAVVEKILRHLGLPDAAPALAPARSSPWQTGLDPLPLPILTEEITTRAVEGEAFADPPLETSDGPGERSPRIRPPP